MSDELTELHQRSASNIGEGGNFTPVEITYIGTAGRPKEIRIYNGSLLVYNASGQTLIDSGVVQTRALQIGALTFIVDVDWTATDKDTATWTAGSIRFSDGTTDTFLTGNTGNIAAKTYIYYEDDNTTLQTTTDFETAIAATNAVLAIVTAGDTGAKCIISPVGSDGATINGDLIVSGDIVGRRLTTASSGARVDILPDANTGIIAYDNAAKEVFKVLVGGADVGDVITGNYAGGAGTKWDKSAGKFYIKGALTTTSAVIGKWNVNATSIYTGTEDHSGYTANAGDITIYSDGSNSSIHSKLFYIDTTGKLHATSASIIGTINALAGGFGTNYNKITIGTSGLTVNASGGIRVTKGYDIEFYSDTDNYSELYYYSGIPNSRTARGTLRMYYSGSAYSFYLGGLNNTTIKIETNGAIQLYPGSAGIDVDGDILPNNSSNKYIGDSTHRLETINCYHYTSPGYLYFDVDVEPAGTSGTKDLGTTSKHFNKLWAYHLGSSGSVVCDTHFVPNVDMTYDLGYNTAGVDNDFFWNNLYVQNAPVVGSTKAKKQNIEPLSMGLNFIRELLPIHYKHRNKEIEVEENILDANGNIQYEYKKELGTKNTIPYKTKTKKVKKMTTHDRYHWGLLAEDVKKAMNKVGLKNEDFGGYCEDINGDAKALRYTEFIASLILSIQELDTEVNKLKGKITCQKKRQ